MMASSKKRLGCIVLASFLFALWVSVAWFLWHLAMNAPTPPEGEKSEPWEIMPRAEGS